MSDPRHSATLSRLRARGRHALPWLRRNRANRWKVLLAPAILGAALFAYPASAGTNFYVATTGSDSNNCTSAETPCLTVAGAITKASGGDTINVAAGTYTAADTVIDKSLTILGDPGTPGIAGPGPNAPVIDGGNLVKDGFRIANGTSGVTISGFVFQNLAPSGFINGSGVGVQAYTQSTSNGTVSQNRFTNVGYGVLVGNDGSGAKYALGTHSNWTISGNIVENVYSIGIEITDTSNSTVSGNVLHMSQRTISHIGPIGIFSWAYIDQTNVTVSGNTIDGTLASYPAIYMYAYPAVASSPYPGAPGATTVTSSTLDGVTINNNLITATLGGAVTHQVQIRAINRTVTATGAVTNIKVQDNSLGTLRNRDTTSTMLATNNWWGQSSGPGVLQTSGTMTTSPWIASYTPDPAKSGAPGFWPTSVVYTSPCTTTCYVAKTGNDGNSGTAAFPFLTIQKGLDSVASGGTVNVAAGVYVESPTISGKPVTLNGAKAGIAAGPLAAPAGRDVNASGGFIGETEIQGTLAVSGTSTAGTVLDGLVVNTESYSVLIWQQATATTVKNCVLTGRPFGTGRALEKQSTTATATANPYVIQNNWISGGEYLMNFNEDRDLTTYLIDGNYLTGGIRGIQTFGSSTGTYTITNNLIEGVTVGIRLSRDGAIIRGNTIRNLSGLSTTQAAVRVDIGVTPVNTEVSSIPQSRGITIVNNTFTNSVYGVSLEKPLSGITYTVTGNRFGGQTGNSLRTVSSQAGTAITATGNYWGQDEGPVGGQVSADANATIDSSSYLTSSSSAALFPGFWSVAAPATTVTAPLTTTSDAPPVAAAVALPSGGSTSLVLDFGNVSSGGNVVVQPASQPSDGNFSFAGNTPISITFSGTFTPPVKVCLSYDDSSFPNGATPALWHYSNGAWSALPTVSLDTVNKVICANTDSFSIFVPGINATDACALNGDVLEVTISSGLKVGLAKSGSTLTVTFDPTSTVCGGGSYTIGGSPGQIRTVQLTGSSGNETVTFSNGSSTNWGANSTSSLLRMIDLGSGTGDTVVLEGTSGSDSLSASGFATLSNVEIYKLDGLGGDDSLIGTTGTQYLYGGSGADKLQGDAGDDSLFGGAGNDSLQGGTGTDCIDYSAETSAVTVNLSAGTASGTGIDADLVGGVECVKGGSGNDSLTGSSGADALYGGGGDDTITGRAGNDAMDGEGGTDTVSYADQTYYGVTVDISTSPGTASGTGSGSDSLTGFENVTGGTGNDTITGSSSANILSGGPGADSLFGGGDADTLNGDGDSDTLNGGAGNDALNGGSGTDTASFTTEPATVTVDLGTGTASGSGSGSDTITTTENATGGSGNDSLTGSSGANTLSGGAGTDQIFGGGAADILYGGADGDTLQGEAGGDTLYGDAGADVLRGGADNDTLRGGADDDTLVGGGGDDRFWGDGGSDTLSYDDVSYSEAALSAITFSLGYVNILQPTGGAGSDVTMDVIENLTGSSFNDKLVGDANNNVLIGLDGTDTIAGAAGNDTCSGEIKTSCEL